MQRILYMREFEQDPETFAKNLGRMAKEGMFAIIRARSMYQRTESPDHVLDFVARICNQFNVGGNYAEVMIEETARANATLKSRMRTEESDVIEAADLVLPLLAPKITRERAAELERIRKELVGSG
jgi:magnesium chelatase subunit D